MNNVIHINTCCIAFSPAKNFVYPPVHQYSSVLPGKFGFLDFKLSSSSLLSKGNRIPLWFGKQKKKKKNSLNNSMELFRKFMEFFWSGSNGINSMEYGIIPWNGIFATIAQPFFQCFTYTHRSLCNPQKNYPITHFSKTNRCDFFVQ